MTFVIILAGFVLLASGTWRQSAIIFGRILRSRLRLAMLGGGYALLAMSLALVLDDDDPSRALVRWFGQLTVAAIIVLVACWLRQRKRDADSVAECRLPDRCSRKQPERDSPSGAIPVPADDDATS
jgi:hypothetical protein